MSMYGNIKKVNGNTFQFDRIYPNRKSMIYKKDSNGNFITDGNNNLIFNDDGVYAGRYVLVEYGERYTNLQSIGEEKQGTPKNNSAALTFVSDLNTNIKQKKQEYFEQINIILELHNKFSGVESSVLSDPFPEGAEQTFSSEAHQNIHLSERTFTTLINAFPDEYLFATEPLETTVEGKKKYYCQIPNQNGEIIYDLFVNLVPKTDMPLSIDENGETVQNSEEEQEAWQNKILLKYFNSNSLFIKKSFQDFVYKKENNYYIILDNRNTSNNIIGIKEFSDYLEERVFKELEKANEKFNNFYKEQIGKNSYLIDKIIEENDEYQANALIDLEFFGAVYDSTVWQKIYIQNQDKYIMVAELNAMAPKLDVVRENPVIFKTATPEEREDGVLLGRYINNNLDIIKLINAKEEYKQAYFDGTSDTELRYLLHYPDNLKLEVGNDTIDFNKNGFNMAYSYGEKEGISTIALLPKITENVSGKYSLTGEVDGNNYHLAKLNNNEKIEVDAKTLFLNFPAIGNAMNTIYNLLYGIPDDDPEELIHGALRPYFKQYIRDINFKNELKARNSKNEMETVKIDGEIKYIAGKIEVFDTNINDWVSNIVEVTCTWDELCNDNGELKTITPSTVVAVCKRKIGNEIKYLIQEDFPTQRSQIQANDKFGLCYNNQNINSFLTWKIKTPTGDEDPDLSWLKNIPQLDKLIKTNAMGLATVLQSLFGIKNPLTGVINYYLYNDWTADSNGTSNIPMILNKPQIVGGYDEIVYQVAEGAESTDFETNGKLPKLTDDGEKIGEETVKYPHIEIHKRKNDKEQEIFGGGHYVVDFTNWQLSVYHQTKDEENDVQEEEQNFENIQLIELRKALWEISLELESTDQQGLQNAMNYIGERQTSQIKNIIILFETYSLSMTPALKSKMYNLNMRLKNANTALIEYANKNSITIQSTFDNTLQEIIENIVPAENMETEN